MITPNILFAAVIILTVLVAVALIILATVSTDNVAATQKRAEAALAVA